MEQPEKLLMMIKLTKMRKNKLNKVIELEKKIAELKHKLNLGEKTDYKNQKEKKTIS